MEISQSASTSSFSPIPVVPGEDLTKVVTQFGSQIVTGSGLIQEQNKIFCVLSGNLNFTKPSTFWVDRRDNKVCKKAYETVAIGNFVLLLVCSI